MLIIRPRPGPDESYFGYILRLTDENQYEHPAWIVELIDGSLKTADATFSAQTWNEEKLARLVALEAADVQAFIHGPAGYDSPLKDHYMFGAPLSVRMIRWKQPRICPLCLEEAPYLRRVWEFALNLCCPLHGRLLIERCPECGNSLNPFRRRKVTVCGCGFDLRSYHPPDMPAHELALTGRIHNLCGLPRGAAPVLPANNGLHGLALKDLMAVLYFFAGHTVEVSHQLGKFLERGRDVRQLHTLLQQVLEIFDHWPHRFYEFIDRRKATASAVRAEHPDGARGGVSGDFGKLYYRLYSKSPAFDFIRIAFDEYLLTRWEGGPTTHMLRRMSEGATSKQRFMSKKQACFYLGIDRDLLSWFIESGKLKTVVSSSGTRRKFILVERASAEDLKAQFDTGLRIRDASRMLGVCLETVHELVNHECLVPLRGPSTDKTRYTLFTAAEIEGLQATLDARMSHGPGLLFQELRLQAVSFMQACAMTRKYGISVGEFTKRTLRGEFPLVGRSSEKILKGLLFEKTPMVRFCREQEEQLEHTEPSLKRVMQLLQCDWRTLRSLQDHGLLECAGKEGTRVKRNSVEEFDQYYIFASRLAHEHGVRCSNLVVQTLARQGVEPLITVEGWKKTKPLFARSNLEGLDLVTLLAGAKRKKIMQERKSLLTFDEAVSALGVDPPAFRSLMDYGLIAPSTHRTRPLRPGDELLFKKEAVSRCRLLMKHKPPLISLDAAAKMLGKETKRFRFLDMRDGRLEPVKTYARSDRWQGRDIFFDREEVLRRKRLKNECLTVGEAAAALGVSQAVIRNLRRKGVLKSVSGPTTDGHKSHLFARPAVEELKRCRQTQ